MKNKILTVLLASVLIFAMAMPVFAFTQGFNYDDFKKNPGADIGDNTETPGDLYNGKALEGYERDDEGETHFVTVDFEVPTAGQYAFWFLVWAHDETCNSLFLSLDGGEIFTCDYYEAPEPDPDFEHYNVWYWMWMNSRQEILDNHEEMGFDGFNAFLSGQKKHFDLSAGAHTLKMIIREPLSRFDGLLITDDLNYDPNNDSALQIGKVDPASVYPDPAIAAAEAAAAEAAAAAAAAEAAEKAAADAAAAAAAAAAQEQPPAPVAPATADPTAVFALISALSASGIAIFKKRQSK